MTLIIIIGWLIINTIPAFDARKRLMSDDESMIIKYRSIVIVTAIGRYNRSCYNKQ